MKAFLKGQRIILLLVSILFVVHWFSKDITNPYERPIVGDAQAYWSYLPAIFIYQDFDYKFVQENATKYYPEGHVKDFIKETENGEKVNKTFPGVAILYAPFFFLAHVAAHLFGYPPDGFSIPYQFFFDLGLWFYFFLGLIFLKEFLLHLQFKRSIALFSTVIIAIGTNVFFYTIYDQSVTHIYNFFMINGMLFSLMLFKERHQRKWLLMTFFLLALIGITRPTNFLVIGLIVIFFWDKHFFRLFFSSILQDWWRIALVVMPVLSVPFILWKIQTGNWIVYSYGEEGFDFTNPHFFEFLFSYTKGWFTYTPIALLILVTGIPVLFIKSFAKGMLVVTFYLISVYVFSSWWCWYYGAGMSQRVMIDHYVQLAYLFALTIQFLQDRKHLLRGFIGVAALLTFLNMAQAYQIKNGIIQFGSATKDQYWDNFLQLTPQARVYPKEHWKLIQKAELQNEAVNTYTVEELKPFSETVSSTIQPFSSNSKVILSFEVKAKSAIKESRAVLLLYDNGNEEAFPYYFKEFVDPGEWVKMEFLFEPQKSYTDSTKLYFWNGGTSEQAAFRSVSISHYKTDQYM